MKYKADDTIVNSCNDYKTNDEEYTMKISDKILYFLLGFLLATNIFLFALCRALESII